MSFYAKQTMTTCYYTINPQNNQPNVHKYLMVILDQKKN